MCVCVCLHAYACVWQNLHVSMLFLTNSSSMLVWHFSRLILLMATRSCRGLQSAAWTTAVAPLPTKHSIHVSNEQSTRRVKDIILDERQTVNMPSGIEKLVHSRCSWSYDVLIGLIIDVCDDVISSFIVRKTNCMLYVNNRSYFIWSIQLFYF